MTPAVAAARPPDVFVSGSSTRQGAYAETSEGIRTPFLAALRAGDVVMIKGSLGSRMALRCVKNGH